MFANASPPKPYKEVVSRPLPTIQMVGPAQRNKTFALNCFLVRILANDELEVGTFELDIFEIIINNLQTYEEGLIKCEC